MACQRRCRDVDVSHKAVVNCDSLCSTFSDALRFVHLDKEYLFLLPRKSLYQLFRTGS